ncbi:MAG TPA: hypothetical protein VF332_11240, partial [Vicinamibacterales bacterium]
MPGSREHASRAEPLSANPAPQVQTGPEAGEADADWLTRIPPTEDAEFGPVERERARAPPAAGAGSDLADGGGMARAGSKCAAGVARSVAPVSGSGDLTFDLCASPVRACRTPIAPAMAVV